jgi:SAM-dependent methyltransferase
MGEEVKPFDNQQNQEVECPVCYSTDVKVFLEIPQVPVLCNVLWNDLEVALSAPRGDIRLGCCDNCAHIYNLTFQPDQIVYTQDYENSLYFSPRFQSYASWLANYIVEQYQLRGKDVIEIGSGKGEFLALLCDLGGNRGIGFDPSYEPSVDEEGRDIPVKFIRDLYSERYAEYKADFICSRQTLEHIHEPVKFLDMIRNAIGEERKTIVFFEVPNVSFILKDLSIWDIIYEHYSYFSRSSLEYLFLHCNFKVCDLIDTYGGQFLCIEALPDERSEKSTVSYLKQKEKLAVDLHSFIDEYRNKVTIWQSKLEEIRRNNQRAVVWGAGSKGVTFLNILDSREVLKYVVDINPRKTGKYIPGSAQQVVSPEFLRDYRPDLIIVMNRIYRQEIIQKVADFNIKTEFINA